MESSKSGENNQSIDHEAGPSNAISPSKPNLFKLDTDCCEEMFEYLKVSELHALGRTCKTMQDVAGDYFQRNYSAADNKMYIDGGKYRGFHRFMSTILFEENSGIYFVKMHLNQFESLNKIKVIGYTKRFNWESIKEILPKVSSLEVETNVRFVINALTTSGRHLKRISLTNSVKCCFNYMDHFFQQTFPNLEYLELRGLGSLPKILEFLERHPTIHTVSNDCDIFYLRYLLGGRNIKLNMLEFSSSSIRHDIFLDNIRQLHAEGFYQRFHINIWNEDFHLFILDQNFLDNIGTIPGLEKLTMDYCEQIPNLNWTPIVSVKELALSHIDPERIDVLSLATALTNLERVQSDTTFTTADQLLPFIRLSQKLKMIKVLFSQPQGAINLQMWNRERGKLDGARKILVYVDDDVFVATKWAAPNGAIDLKFIQIKRYESCE